MPFLKEFSTFEAVIAELLGMASNGYVGAIILWPTEQFGKREESPTLEAYINEGESLEAFGLKDNWYEIREEVYAKLLLPGMLKEVVEFENHPRETGHVTAGKLIETKVFPTSIGGLLIQVIHLESWWQAFGGAHIGDNKRILLINREPFETAVS